MTDYIGEERRNPNGWHFRKDIHLGHLIATFMILITLVSMFFNLNKEISKNTIINERQDQQRVNAERRITHRLDIITSDVREIRNAVVTHDR